MKGEHLTFHVGIKNGGWGLHRDEYEGYNRLSRKMGEAAVVSLATLLGSRSHQACVDEFVQQQGRGGSGAVASLYSAAAAAAAASTGTSSAASNAAVTAAATACARRGVAANLPLQDHVTGMGALKQHQKKPYKRVKDVHRECQALRSHLPFVGAAVDELSKVTVARGAEMMAARAAAEAERFEQELGGVEVVKGQLATNMTAR